MTAFLKYLLAIIAVSYASLVHAEGEGSTAPNPAQIRTYYDQISAEWDPVPVGVLNAFVAAEDRGFYDTAPQFSPLTQQLSSWFALPQQTSKLQKTAISFVIAEALSTDEILRWYVNAVYLGEKCFGVEGAAKAYFGKTVGDLSVPEIATLAALPKAPMFYHPEKSYEKALARRNFVLSEMAIAGFITEDAARTARQTDLISRSPISPCKEE